MMEHKLVEKDGMGENSVQKGRLYRMTMAALVTAVTCILAPLALPIGPVPISLTNLVLYFSLYLLGWKLGTISLCVYLLLGAVGLPVFSGFAGGLAKLVGPTGGYLIGFLPMMILTGIMMEKSKKRWVHFLAMVVGTAVCYAFGTMWFCVVMDSTVGSALMMCVIPFIPGDLIKIVLAVLGGPGICKRLQKAGVLG